MGKKNRRTQKSLTTEPIDMGANPFGGLDLPDLPTHDQPNAPAAKPAPKETLRLRIEKKGRGGKTVTVIDGFEQRETEVASLLKKSLGIGGSHFEGIVELQGDCRKDVAQLLRDQGYKVKGA
jgi:translation initiation factor 1